MRFPPFCAGRCCEHQSQQNRGRKAHGAGPDRRGIAQYTSLSLLSSRHLIDWLPTRPAPEKREGQLPRSFRRAPNLPGHLTLQCRLTTHQFDATQGQLVCAFPRRSDLRKDSPCRAALAFRPSFSMPAPPASTGRAARPASGAHYPPRPEGVDPPSSRRCCLLTWQQHGRDKFGEESVPPCGASVCRAVLRDCRANVQPSVTSSKQIYLQNICGKE